MEIKALRIIFILGVILLLAVISIAILAFYYSKNNNDNEEKKNPLRPPNPPQTLCDIYDQNYYNIHHSSEACYCITNSNNNAAITGCRITSINQYWQFWKEDKTSDGNDTYQIINAGKVLAQEGDTKVVLKTLDIFDDNPNNKQKWILTAVPKTSLVLLQNVDSRKCINSNNTSLYMSTCDSANVHMRWILALNNL